MDDVEVNAQVAELLEKDNVLFLFMYWLLR